jgi:hypothetical protein
MRSQSPAIWGVVKVRFTAMAPAVKVYSVCVDCTVRDVCRACARGAAAQAGAGLPISR